MRDLIVKYSVFTIYNKWCVAEKLIFAETIFDFLYFHKTNLIREENIGTNYLEYRDIAPFKWLYNLLVPSFSKDQLEESNMTCHYFKVSTFI